MIQITPVAFTVMLAIFVLLFVLAVTNRSEKAKKKSGKDKASEKYSAKRMNSKKTVKKRSTKTQPRQHDPYIDAAVDYACCVVDLNAEMFRTASKMDEIARECTEQEYEWMDPNWRYDAP